MRYYEDMSWQYGRRRLKPEPSGCLVLYVAFLLLILLASLALGMLDIYAGAADGSTAGANAVTESQIATDNN